MPLSWWWGGREEERLTLTENNRSSRRRRMRIDMKSKSYNCDSSTMSSHYVFVMTCDGEEWDGDVGCGEKGAWSCRS